MAVVQSLLQDCKSTGELCDFGLDNVALLIVFLVAEYLSVYHLLVQGIRGQGENIEPCGWPAKKLEEPGGHGFGQGG